MALNEIRNFESAANLDEQLFLVLDGIVGMRGPPPRRERSRSSPTLMPVTTAETFCTGCQTLRRNCVPASSTVSSAPVRMRSAWTNWPRKRSDASVKMRSIFCACPRARYTTCAASATSSEIFGCVSSSRNLHARQNRPDARLQVVGELIQALHGAPHLEKQRGKHRHLNHDSDGRNDDKYRDPSLHAHPGRPTQDGLHSPNTQRNSQSPKDLRPYDFDDSRRYASRPASTAAESESFLRTATSLLRSINSSARSRSSRALRCA